MVGGTIVIRVSALEPVVRGCFWGGDGLPRGGAFLGVWKFSRYVGLLVMTAARGVSRDPPQWLSELTAVAL